MRRMITAPFESALNIIDHTSIFEEYGRRLTHSKWPMIVLISKLGFKYNNASELRDNRYISNWRRSLKYMEIQVEKAFG